MPGVSIPGLRATLGIGAPAPESTTDDWGELRSVKTRVRVRAARNTNSDIVGMLEIGEDPSAAIGYVYAPLLIPAQDETMADSG